MKPTITWFATFNGADARIYHWHRAERKLTPIALALVAGQHRPEFTDRPTRSFSSTTPARGAGDPRTNPERALETAFVSRVTDALTERAKADAFDQIIVAAPPRALGAFREVASTALLDRVRLQLLHDYLHTPVAELATILQDNVVP